MKLQNFSVLFIIANALNVLGNNNIRSNETNEKDTVTELTESLESFQPSTECLAETTKYQACITDKLKLDSTSLSNFDDLKKDEIDKLCTNLESKECQPLVSDASKTESACLSADSKKTNGVNTLFGLFYYTLKQYYLLYCSKSVDGKTCPFTEYLVNHPEVAEGDSDELPTDAKEALIADCKDANCNERMITINKLNDFMDSLHIDGLEVYDDSNSTDIYKMFIEDYKQMKCDSINNVDAVIGGQNSTNTNTSNDNAERSASTNVQMITFTSVATMIAAIFMLIM